MPTHTHREYHPSLTGCFEFYGSAYSLRAAAEIIENAPRELVRVAVDDWHPLLRKPRAPRSQFSIGVQVDWARIDRGAEGYDIDLSVPLIIATVSQRRRQYIVIDGWHRIARAWREGIVALPGYLLTSTETRHILAR